MTTEQLPNELKASPLTWIGVSILTWSTASERSEDVEEGGRFRFDQGRDMLRK